MATERKTNATARSNSESRKDFYVSRYGREMFPAAEAPYFLMGTAAVALPATHLIEVGFFKTYGVIVTAPALENVVFLPFDVTPS
ncbi:MAG: hypothetical protein V3W11_07325 [bacterium]